MQYPQQPSQPQHASDIFFYQPDVNSRNGDNVDFTSTQVFLPQQLHHHHHHHHHHSTPPPPPPAANFGYHRSTNSAQFFSGEEDVNSQQNLQHFSQPHAMSIGVATPTLSRVDSCSSQRAFGITNASGSNGTRDCSLSQQHVAIRTQSPSLGASSKPFVQPPRSSSPSSVPMMIPSTNTYEPVFHNSTLQAPQPFIQQLQQQPYQEPPSMAASSPRPQRNGFFANMLNILLPQDSTAAGGNGGGGPQEMVPPHQRRFGHPEDDLPLLEELGIIPHQIRCRALAVLNPFKSMAPEAVEDMDLAGPIVFAVFLAFLLSLQGKLEFNTIYGHSLFGVIFMKILLSLMTDHGVALQFVISALGYCLIPNLILAVCQSFVYWLFGRSGKAMLCPALLIVLWSAWCATAMLVSGLSMEKQRYLILYPIFLFYAVFATLTIF